MAQDTKTQLTPFQQAEKKRVEFYYKKFESALTVIGVSGVIPLEFQDNVEGVWAFTNRSNPYKSRLVYGFKNLSELNAISEIKETLKKGGFEEQKAERLAYYVVFAHENFHALSHGSALNSGKSRVDAFNEDLGEVTKEYFDLGKDKEWPLSVFEQERETITDALEIIDSKVPVDMLAVETQAEESTADKSALVLVRQIEGLDQKETQAFASAIESWRSKAITSHWSVKSKHVESKSVEGKSVVRESVDLFIEDLKTQSHSTGDLKSFALSPKNLILSPAALLREARKDTMQSLILPKVSKSLSGELTNKQLEELSKRDAKTSEQLGCKNDLLNGSIGLSVLLPKVGEQGNDFLRKAASLLNEQNLVKKVISSNVAPPLTEITSALDSFRRSRDLLIGQEVKPENVILGCGFKSK